MRPRDSRLRFFGAYKWLYPLLVVAGWGFPGAGTASEPGAPAPPPADAVFLRAVAEGYLSNREAFAFLTCRFRVTSGEAATVADGLKGRLENGFSARGLWLVHGPNVRFELVCDARQVAALLGQGEAGQGVAIPLPSLKYLDDGSRQLHYSLVAGSGQIHSPENQSPGILLTPFDMGIMGFRERANPGRMIGDSLRQKQLCRFEGTQPIEGVETLVVTVGESAAKADYKYFLDPKRGFLPVQIWVPNPRGEGLLSKLYVTDLRECSGGRWFPARSVLIWGPEQPKGPFHVREITVTDLEVNTPPKEEDFFLELPEGGLVNDGINPNSQIALRKAARIGLNDLEQILGACRAAAEVKRPTSQAGNPTFILLTVIVAAVLPLVAFLLLGRYRKSRRVVAKAFD